MEQAPLKLVQTPGPPPDNGGLRGPGGPGERGPSRRPGAPTPRRIARRRGRVMIAKWVLPVVALALLTAVAAWPELSKDATGGRLVFRRGMAESQSGQLKRARYNGVDQQGRPYTVTADTATQVTPDRIDLTNPVGDMTLEGGSWIRGEGKKGVYMQQSGLLDLQDNVVLYRDDGITMQTDSATLDVKAGAASSSAMVHVEGPFGTLDAQGFTLVDRGTAVQFSGPGRLVINEQKKSDVLNGQKK